MASVSCSREAAVAVASRSKWRFENRSKWSWMIRRARSTVFPGLRLCSCSSRQSRRSTAPIPGGSIARIAWNASCICCGEGSGAPSMAMSRAMSLRGRRRYPLLSRLPAMCLAMFMPSASRDVSVASWSIIVSTIPRSSSAAMDVGSKLLAERFCMGVSARLSASASSPKSSLSSVRAVFSEAMPSWLSWLSLLQPSAVVSAGFSSSLRRISSSNSGTDISSTLPRATWRGFMRCCRRICCVCCSCWLLLMLLVPGIRNAKLGFYRHGGGLKSVKVWRVESAVCLSVLLFLHNLGNAQIIYVFLTTS